MCREQSSEYGAKIYTETVNSVDMQHGTPFTLLTDTKVVQADSLIIATGAAAKRLKIPGTDEETGFWNKGISACAVCDGSSPLFRYWACRNSSSSRSIGQQQQELSTHHCAASCQEHIIDSDIAAAACHPTACCVSDRPLVST